MSSWTGAQLETQSNANAVTNFRRPEDGSWDPVDPNVFYFVTTDAFGGKSRLWKLNFADASRPELGGTIDMLLDGTEGQPMLDNIRRTAAARSWPRKTSATSSRWAMCGYATSRRTRSRGSPGTTRTASRSAARVS